jgi:hypothetical protein
VFGIVTLQGSAVTVHGVFAPNDVRKMKLLPQRLTDWEKEAQALGLEGADIWNDLCQVCSETGKLYMCYGCNTAYHPKCSVDPVLFRKLKDNEEFLCPACLRDCVDKNAIPPPVELVTEQADAPPLVASGYASA